MNEKKKREAVISIAVKDKQALYMSYMPFIEGGGLFVPSKKEHSLGDEMFFLARIMDEPEPVKISGKVVWMTPKGALGNKPVGIGVQFIGDDAPKVKDLIESKLGASLSLTRSTYTM